MKINKRKIQIFSITLFAMFSLAAVVQAATVAFTYQGWGISYAGKPSLSQTYVARGATLTVAHNQKASSSGPSNVGMNVVIARKVWNGWSRVSSRTFYNNSGGQFSANVGEGTYRLEFAATGKHKTFDISGTVYK